MALRLLLITLTTVLLTFIINFLLPFDTLSAQFQVVRSTLFLCASWLIVFGVLKKSEFPKFLTVLVTITLIIFLTLNLIKHEYGFIFHDNGYVPMWMLVEQINYGYPFIIFRSLGDSIKVLLPGMENTLIHIDAVFENVFIALVVIAVETIIYHRIQNHLRENGC